MATRLPRPKRTLYRFSVKRVFDSITAKFKVLHYTGTEAGGDVPEGCVMSAVKGNQKFSIFLWDYPGELTIHGATRKIDSHLLGYDATFECKTQAEVNRSLAEIFTAFERNGGTNGKA